MTKLTGIMTAMATPFDEKGRLDLGAVGPYLDFQRSHGVSGVVVSGTNGEGTSLTTEERKLLLETVIEHRGSLSVIAGTGAAAVGDAVELTIHAGQAGADACLTLPPFFFKNPTDAGLIRYFRTVMDAASVPVLLYNIPHFSAVTITDGVIAGLVDHPRMGGMKDSAGDWERSRYLIERYPNLVILTGSDDLISKARALGNHGTISGTANPFPDLVVSIWNSETDEAAEAAQARWAVARKILVDYPLIGASKSVMAHRGCPRMWVRPPLVDCTEAQEAEMMSRLQDAGIL